MRIAAYLSCAAATLLAALALAASGSLQEQVVFTAYAATASSLELVHRLLSPLAAAQVEQTLQDAHKQLPEQVLDLAQETFTVYVPALAPPQGYALLVFIPPWQQAHLPRGWDAVLDRHGMIFVSAAGSGNEANVFARRAPLALLAAHNLMQRYPVDPHRVYVGGFSGGARVAERLALAYPDLFRGALLNASSDPIDGKPVVAPSAALLQRFQESVRLVYATGEHDSANLGLDVASVQSMHHWCVFDTDTEVILGSAHEVMPASAFEYALRSLLSPAATDAARLSSCRAALEKEIAGQLQRVADLAAAGRNSDAQKLLDEVDRRFGGTAAPRSLELQSQLQAPRR